MAEMFEHVQFRELKAGLNCTGKGAICSKQN